MVDFCQEFQLILQATPLRQTNDTYGELVQPAYRDPIQPIKLTPLVVMITTSTFARNSPQPINNVILNTDLQAISYCEYPQL